MRTLFLVLALALAAVSATTIAAVSSVPGYYREYTFAELPNAAAPDGIAAKGTALQYSANGNGNGTAVLNAAAFAFQNPGLYSSTGQTNVAFYFGFLSASLSYDATVAIASVSGALAEVAAAFTELFVWYDQDGVPGFQTVLGNIFWDCTTAAAASPKYDCIKPAYTLSMQNLTWSTIAHTNMSCPAGYNSKCSIHLFTTTGSYASQTVITVVLKLASQPVFIDGVEVKPEYGKIDITIQYPWATMGVTDADAHVGLTLVGAGKDNSFAGQVSNVNSQPALSFHGTGTSAFFSWAGTATVNQGQSTVYVQGITGDQLTAYTCTGSLLCLIVDAVFAPYKVAVGAWQAFGWKVEVIFFSWTDNQPSQVAWDPTIGSTSSAAIPAGSLAFAVGSLLFLLWNHLFRF